ncbi:MAG TPA: molybdopterin-synthase adenylyltransferase MoeB [Ardenticatenaceae bacterium]|nr:molybdopterin-synthase adenylyltransferase MoeB [Ardenticatenaceae bacterium]
MAERVTRDRLLARARSEVRETDVRALAERRKREPKLRVVDIRERDEFEQGYIPGAEFIPRGFLELQIEEFEPNREAPIVVYCAGGVRSLLGAKALQEMGYTNVESLAGGFGAWKNAGFGFDLPRTFSDEQRVRYSRHTLIPEVGEAGQWKLLDAKVLLIGAGGLGSPAALYLAAAGIGTLGIVDFDVVDVSNLQRQILHGLDDVGTPKVESARRTIENLNPDVKVIAHDEPLTSANIMEIIADYDIVVNGSDNFPTRDLVNDACAMAGKTLVDGSIFQFEGQLTVYKADEGPCYRCLYPTPPPPGEVPSCAEGGVLGVLPGVIGSLQAVEVIKLVLGTGEPLIGRLLLYDALSAEFREVKLRKNRGCPVCGEDPSITELIDYEQFCGAAFPAREESGNGHGHEQVESLAKVV